MLTNRYLQVLLDLLDTDNSGPVQCATLLTLVCALLDNPANTRVSNSILPPVTTCMNISILIPYQTFEVLDGLATVTSLFKRRDTPREVKLKILEFLYFYLMPETAPGSTDKPSTPLKHKVGEKTAGDRQPSRTSRRKDDIRLEKTTEEKQRMLGEFMSNVEGLVADLRESQPFGM